MSNSGSTCTVPRYSDDYVSWPGTLSRRLGWYESHITLRMGLKKRISIVLVGTRSNVNRNKTLTFAQQRQDPILAVSGAEENPELTALAHLRR